MAQTNPFDLSFDSLAGYGGGMNAGQSAYTNMPTEVVAGDDFLAQSLGDSLGFNFNMGGAEGEGGGFMDSLGGMSGIGSLIGGAGDLLGAWTSMKNYGLMEDALEFQQDAYKTDLHNKATLAKDSANRKAQQRAVAAGATPDEARAAGSQHQQNLNIKGNM